MAGLGRIEYVFIAVTISHAAVKGGVEGVETANRRPRLGVVPHEYLQESAGDPLLFVQKIGGDVGRSPHRHHHTSCVEGEIHHQNGAQQGPIVVKTAEVTSLVRSVQLAFQILQQGGRRLGWKRGDHVPRQLSGLRGENEPDIQLIHS